MTKRDFFRMIIKLFGLYSMIQTVFNFIPSNMGYLLEYFDLAIFIGAFSMTAFVILIFVFLIFRTDQIIDLLKIERGFDDDQIILGNFSSQQIMKLAIIIIGGMLLIDYLTEFLQYSFLAFKENMYSNGNLNTLGVEFGSSIDYFYWAISGINIILGYILITNYSKISKWLLRNENYKNTLY